MNLDNKEISVHRELLGSLESSPIGSNDKEALSHRGPLGFSAINLLEQTTSPRIMRETVVFDDKGEPISLKQELKFRIRIRECAEKHSKTM